MHIAVAHGNLGNQTNVGGVCCDILYFSLISVNEDFVDAFTSLSFFSIYKPLYVLMECAIGLLNVIICQPWFNLPVLYSVSHTEASCGQ